MVSTVPQRGNHIFLIQVVAIVIRQLELVTHAEGTTVARSSSSALWRLLLLQADFYQPVAISPLRVFTGKVVDLPFSLAVDRTQHVCCGSFKVVIGRGESSRPDFLFLQPLKNHVIVLPTALSTFVSC